MVYWRGAQPPISVLWPQFWHLHLPTVAIRLNGNRHIGRPVADVLHFHLDRGFEFGGCFAWFFHRAVSPLAGLYSMREAIIGREGHWQSRVLRNDLDW